MFQVAPEAAVLLIPVAVHQAAIRHQAVHVHQAVATLLVLPAVRVEVIVAAVVAAEAAAAAAAVVAAVVVPVAAVAVDDTVYTLMK